MAKQQNKLSMEAQNLQNPQRTHTEQQMLARNENLKLETIRYQHGGVFLFKKIYWFYV